MGVKQYCYKVYPPTEHLDKIREQIELARKYRNRLAQIELDRRAKCSLIIRAAYPAYDTCFVKKAAVDGAIALLKRSIKQMRRNDPERAPLREQLPELYGFRKILEKAEKSLRTTAYAMPEVRVSLNTLEAECKIVIKEARATCGLYWGNYAMIEQAAKAFRSGTPPRLRDFDGTGTIAVQFQNGIAVPDFLEKPDTRVDMTIPPELEETLFMKGKAGLSSGTADVKFRIGSLESRKPLFAPFRAIISRPLPSNGIIKWAYITLTKVGSTEHWQLRILVDVPQAHRAPVDHDIVAVHMGYRRMPDRVLRVATAFGSDGVVQELVLPAKELGWLGKSDDLQSIRDDSFNLIKLRLHNWLEERVAFVDPDADPEEPTRLEEEEPAARTRVPQWLVESCRNLQYWKRIVRLSNIVERWRGERFAGDEVIFAEVEAWRKQDKHLYDWWANGTAKQIRRRDITYRRFVAELAKQYNYVTFANVQWAKMSKKAEELDEDDEFDGDTGSRFVRRMSRLAAPATLQRFLQEKFQENCLKVPAAHISDTCHQCQSRILNLDHRIVTCVNCGDLDQDYNASRTTLLRAYEARARELV